ncbi:disintegrin and metalloproteinase domain-containing protein adm-2-like [Plodia interpunctella]|uniref:disintegrin and metalloproteinase domain-containing protein adm-2-like n=1 Tax=Plodia interpunctella TaxID=58824 RepID=UPI002367A2B0|nr:disintegrin and metalloproteinase domain-containing protein 15-like [Plodia interpunctella]
MCDNVCAWCLVLCSLFLLVLTKDGVEAQGFNRPAKDFSRHRVVQPVVLHGRTKREISTTRDKSGTHHPELAVTLDIDGEKHILDLRLNYGLVTADHTISYQQNGNTVVRQPNKEEIDLCQYSGSLRDKPGSFAAVSTCHGLRGVIYDGEQMRYIEPAEGGGIQSNHYIYDHTDLKTQHKHKCGYNGGVTKNATYDQTLFDKYHREKDVERSRVSRYKRDTSDMLVRGPYNANKMTRYVELVLVSDNGEYLANRESLQTVHHQLKDIANIINAVYSPLNIFIALVGVVVWTERDEIVLEENGDTTLTNFLHYRRKVLLTDKRLRNDNAHLITRQKFKEGVVGKALKGPICTYEFSGGVANNHSEVIGLVATTIAHEMGHNFGMEHDTDDCECPDDKCIMSPSSTSVMPTHWSKCSLSSLVLAFARGMDYCLRNKPKQLFSSPTCGNGFVEPGEQCDCGLPLSAAGRSGCLACCDPDTCMLRANASCGAGACCDLQTCRPKSAGVVCRAAERECDLPEYCSGYSEFCPEDVFKMDTTPCAKGEAYCVHGSCRSRGDQCRLLWGVTGESSHDRCYTSNNIKGSKNGNCGYDRETQVYRACAAADAMCGMLQCRHLNERLEFGMESVAVLNAVFINNNGTIIPCRTAIIDLGLSDVDPGMVPDGAQCGAAHMCLNQRCVPVEYVRELISQKQSSVCPSNCSGHGVCNSEGHCHCEAGFAPPQCALPGAGGSVDAGPATDPNVQHNFMVAMYIIFLGIIPSILLILFLIYYSRHNVLMWWKKPRKSVQSPKKSSLQQRLSRSASKFAANFQGGSPGAAAPAVHTLSNPDDMSSSLLRNDSDRSPSGNLNPTACPAFFGNFKGFSLTPIDKNQTEEQPKTQDKSAKITPVHRSSSITQTTKPILRTAPPLPVVPVTAKTSPKSSPSVKRTNSTVQNRIKALIGEKDDATPSIPPPRPVISSPILEASTCTAKELISPLQGSKTLGPMRTAPTIPKNTPDLPQRPLSMHSATVPTKPLPEEPKKVKEGISLNRIASFLKQEKPKEKERNPVERSNSLPKNPIHQIKFPKTDKGTLRNLQISNPILQKDIELPVNTVPVVSDSEDNEDSKPFVNRAQSMRAPATQKPNIQSFGSMRQTAGTVRPLSMVGRPTAPPPPLPNDNQTYQTPKETDKSTDYVDCIEEKQAPLAHIDEESGDNIYAIIEESPIKHAKSLPGASQPIPTKPQPPPEGYMTPKSIPSNSGSAESMGLLGEIVNEIQNRNFDSIYSASTLARKKAKKESAENNRDSTYMNTDHYRAPESVYSNSGAKSTASTTSSGYLHPSAVNVPTFQKEQDRDDNEKAPPSPTLKGSSKIPTFTRQVTPPALKTSTFKNVPQSPKNGNRNPNLTQKITNSPDVVSSCSVADTKVKAPDVVNNNKVPNEPPKVATKPTIKIDNRPPLRPAPTIDKKPSTKPTPSLKNQNVKDKNPTVLRANSKTDSNVKAIADNLNKNKPKVVPKPSNIVQRTDSNVKQNSTKLSSKPSNVASLQQKFENRKSFGKEVNVAKK